MRFEIIILTSALFTLSSLAMDRVQEIAIDAKNWKAIGADPDVHRLVLDYLNEPSLNAAVALGRHLSKETKEIKAKLVYLGDERDSLCSPVVSDFYLSQIEDLKDQQITDARSKELNGIRDFVLFEKRVTNKNRITLAPDLIDKFRDASTEKRLIYLASYVDAIKENDRSSAIIMKRLQYLTNDLIGQETRRILQENAKGFGAKRSAVKDGLLRYAELPYYLTRLNERVLHQNQRTLVGRSTAKRIEGTSSTGIEKLLDSMRSTLRKGEYEAFLREFIYLAEDEAPWDKDLVEIGTKELRSGSKSLIALLDELKEGKNWLRISPNEVWLVHVNELVPTLRTRSVRLLVADKNYKVEFLQGQLDLPKIGGIELKLGSRKVE